MVLHALHGFNSGISAASRLHHVGHVGHVDIPGTYWIPAPDRVEGRLCAGMMVGGA